jgi:hypothetical protein
MENAVTPKTVGEASTPEAQLQSFNDRFDPAQQKFIQSVRAALRKRFPTANELAYDYSSFFVIAYSPTEQGIEAPISLAFRADRVELYFNHGPQLADPKKLLRGSGKLTRFIQLDTVKQLDDPDVKAFIAATLELSKIPLPSKGKGSLIIKTNKTGAAKKKKSRPKAKK